MNLSAVILAGGESRRMGQDKAWLEVGGQSLLARAVSTVRDSGIKEILISGRPGADYSTLRRPVLLDLEPGYGPLSGTYPPTFQRPDQSLAQPEAMKPSQIST